MIPIVVYNCFDRLIYMQNNMHLYYIVAIIIFFSDKLQMISQWISRIFFLKM